MRLLDELFDADDGLTGARCVWTCGGEGYLQGVKGLTKFSSEEIFVLTRLGEVKVTGKNLSVKKYADGDLYIGGNVFTLSMAGKGQEC